MKKWSYTSWFLWKEKKRKEINDLEKRIECIENDNEKQLEKLNKAKSILNEIEIPTENNNENLDIFLRMRKNIKNENECVIFDQLKYDLTIILMENNVEEKPLSDIEKEGFDYAIEQIENDKHLTTIKNATPSHNLCGKKLSKRQQKKQKKREQRELRKARKQEKKYRRGQVSFQLEEYIG